MCPFSNTHTRTHTHAHTHTRTHTHTPSPPCPPPQVLQEFGVEAEINIVSAHRTPELMMDYARNAHKRGLKVIIAGAGAARGACPGACV